LPEALFVAALERFSDRHGRGPDARFDDHSDEDQRADLAYSSAEVVDIQADSSDEGNSADDARRGVRAHF
jgi:hypothetical protein